MKSIGSVTPRNNIINRQNAPVTPCKGANPYKVEISKAEILPSMSIVFENGHETQAHQKQIVGKFIVEESKVWSRLETLSGSLLQPAATVDILSFMTGNCQLLPSTRIHTKRNTLESFHFDPDEIETLSRSSDLDVKTFFSYKMWLRLFWISNKRWLRLFWITNKRWLRLFWISTWIFRLQYFSTSHRNLSRQVWKHECKKERY